MEESDKSADPEGVAGKEPSHPPQLASTIIGTVALDLGKRFGQLIGRYKVVRVLGEGGMGTVFLAKQDKPTRLVAMKVIRPGVASANLLRRFEHEAQVLGRLQHPGIAQIYEAGTADTGEGAQPYFVMEYVRGRSLLEYAQGSQLGTRQRLELLAKICDAVQHAHQKGIIHRDLKPGNILVTEEGQPKILDFGVARATDADIQATIIQTDVGQLVGTVPYMSPEQAGGDAAELDTRSDVYALGVLGYELLAGRLPYDLSNKMIHEAVRVIREDDPTPLSSIDRVFRGDVETIIAKALQKERTRRYQSASDLAGDIRRYLSDQPIVARPPSVGYQLRKFTKRNKALVAGVLAVFVVLVGGIVTTSVALAREGQQRRIAQAAEMEQGRARQDAEQAREQAEAAEREQSRARQEAEQTSNQLKIVTAFQQSMLGDVDAEAMGNAIFDDLREGIRESLEAKNTAREDIDEALASFDASVTGVNATDLALKIIDENVLSRAVETIEKEFADQPLVRAALQQTVADTYEEIGLFEPAIPLQEVALRTRREELGDDHPRTMTSINNMGQLLKSMGKAPEAEPYLRKALEGKRRVLGDDHPDTLALIDDMGYLLQSMGEYEEALVYYHEALESRRRILGNDHPDTLRSIGNMGYLRLRMGELGQADRLGREALEGWRRVLGEEQPHTLSSINNIGRLLRSFGRLQEAMPYYHEALERNRRLLGDHHPDTLTSISNMGRLLQRMRKPKEAEPYYREALAGFRRVLGGRHPDTLTSINNLGALLLSMGKYEEPLVYFQRALEGRRRVLGHDHPDTLISIDNMGWLLESMGKFEEAEPYYRQAIEGRRRVLGDDHPVTLRSLGNMGRLLQEMDRLSEAEPYFREALEGYRHRLPRQPVTVNATNNLANLYREQGRMDEARALVRALLKSKRRWANQPNAPARQKNACAWLLLTCEPDDLRDPKTALRLARGACAMTDNANHVFLDTLALAQHLTGDTAAAIKTETKALSLLSADAPRRGEYEAALARFEAALEDESK